MKVYISFLLLYLVAVLNAPTVSALNNDAILPTNASYAQPQLVDLGLSVLWADRNYGAESLTDYGEMYGWGAPASDSFNSTYPTINDIRETSYDVCHSQNENLRMPSYDELEELRTKCEWTYTTMNNTAGFSITGPNGNSIFIPAAGALGRGEISERGDNAFIWSGVNKNGKYYASCLHVHSKTYQSNPIFMSYTGKEVGMTIRAVATKEIITYPYIVRINNLEYTLHSNLTAQLNEQKHQLDKDVVVPKTVEYQGKTYVVNSIASYALKGHNEVASLLLNCEAPKIGHSVFADMKGLKLIEYNIHTYIPDYNYTSQMWSTPPFQDCDNLEEVIFGKDVEIVLPYFFKDTPGIESIVIPSNVKDIKTDCFASMPNLLSITLEEGVSSISTAFASDCKNLTSVYFNCSECKINSDYLTSSYPPFGDRTPKLNNLYIGEKVRLIDRLIFGKCATLKNIYTSAKTPPTCDATSNFASDVKKNATLYVPFGTLQSYKSAPVWKEFVHIVEMQDFPQVVMIDNLEYTLYEDLTAQLNFQKHKLNTDITIPSSVKYNGKQFSVNMIVENALRGHNEVQSLSLNFDAAGVGAYSFGEMSGLKKIHYDVNTTRADFNYSRTIWKKFVFKDCNNLERLTFGESVVNTIPYFFSGCPGIKSFEIPSSVKTLGSDCFTYMNDLEEVTLGEGLESLDVALFDYCGKLATVYYNCIDCATVENYLTPYYPPFGKNNKSFVKLHIGNNVTKIHGRTFSQCYNLKEIYVSAITPPTCDESINFSDEAKRNAILYVPKGKKSVYETASVWKEFMKIVEYDFSEIDDLEYSSPIIPAGYYDINGVHYDTPQPGFNIMIDTDGKAHKFIKR